MYLHAKAYRVFDLSGKAGLPITFFLILLICGKQVLRLKPSPDNPFRDLWTVILFWTSAAVNGAGVIVRASWGTRLTQQIRWLSQT